MSLDKNKPGTDIIFYGKKVYYLNEELARIFEPEQVKLLIFEDIETTPLPILP